MIATAAVLVAAACGNDRGPRSAAASADSSCDTPTPAAATGACELPSASPSDTLHPAPKSRTIVFLGTSLTAGLGLDPSQSYPALIQRYLDSLRLGYTAVNAGVSGETSAGALRRLDWVLRQPPAILVIETGANDGLRGLELDSTRANIEEIIVRARRADPGVRIVLAGMQVPPNLGPAYAARFRALFPQIAVRQRVTFIPFLLAGVGGVDSLNQADGIHPNGKGERIVAANVWRVLEPLVRTGASLTPDP